MCGASNEQKQVFQDQNNTAKEAANQMQQIFGSSSSVFNDLMSAFSPIVAKGPDQQGFSLAENAALKSQAISDTGDAYKHASQAVRQQQAAQGGGTVALPGGASIGANVNIANEGAAQTASALNKINLANYDTGRQNFFQAANELQQAPGVFNPATSATNAATNSEAEAAKTADSISQANNSWVNAVSGALGGVTSSLIAPGGWLGKAKP